MSLQSKASFFALLFSLLFFFPHAVHGRHGSSAHRHQHVHRQFDSSGGLDGLVSSILNPSGTSSIPSSQLSTSSPAPDSSSATTAASTTAPASSSGSNLSSVPSASTSSSPQTSNPSTSLPPTSSPQTSSPLTSDSALTSSPVTSPQSSQPSSSPSTSTSGACLLGVDLLGQCILPAVSTTSSGSPPSSASTDVPTSVSSSQPPLSSTTSSPSPSSNTPSSSPPPSTIPISLPLTSSIPISLPLSSSDPISLPPLSSNPVSLPLSSSNPVSLPLSSSDPISLPLSSSNPISLPLSSSNPTSLPLSNGISFPPLSSSTPISSPPPGVSSPPVSSSSSDLPSQSNLAPTTSQPALSSSPSNNQSPPPTPSSSPPVDPCGPFGLPGLCVTTSSNPISVSTPSLGSIPQQSSTLNPSPSLDSSPPLSAPSSINPGVSSSSGLSLPLSSAPSSSQSGASSIPGSVSQPASGTAAESSTAFSGGISGTPTTSAPPVISFPTDTTSSGDQTSGVQSTGPSTPVFTPTPNSQFSYVTESSLLGTSLSTSSIPPTLTNPDAATTTLSLPDPSNSVTGSGPGAPLPSYLPARIYAPDQVDVNSLPSDYTLVALLFSSFLSWQFVAQNTQSQGQIFDWTPIIVANALNISAAQAPAYALQVFTPASYSGPSNVDALLTEYLFYLPSSQVLTLANQIKVASSPFYAISDPYKELADQINPAFALTSVSNPNTVPGSASGASSLRNKSRTDTIIGVVSGLGGLALIILGILIFNSVKRSRQLRHHRLSDPSLPNDPYPDRTGREFDQDSLGGPRRRSFYFAEDSLRGQPHTAEQSSVPMAQAQTQYVVQQESQIQYIPRTSPENIRERRAPVVPGTISAPILTQSSLNW